ncbi:unnamed protein product [Lampetra planeri]
MQCHWKQRSEMRERSGGRGDRGPRGDCASQMTRALELPVLLLLLNRRHTMSAVRHRRRFRFDPSKPP